MPNYSDSKQYLPAMGMWRGIGAPEQMVCPGCKTIQEAGLGPRWACSFCMTTTEDLYWSEKYATFRVPTKATSIGLLEYIRDMGVPLSMWQMERLGMRSEEKRPWWQRLMGVFK